MSESLPFDARLKPLRFQAGTRLLSPIRNDIVQVPCRFPAPRGAPSAAVRWSCSASNMDDGAFAWVCFAFSYDLSHYWCGVASTQQ